MSEIDQLITMMGGPSLHMHNLKRSTRVALLKVKKDALAEALKVKKAIEKTKKENRNKLTTAALTSTDLKEEPTKGTKNDALLMYLILLAFNKNPIIKEFEESTSENIKSLGIRKRIGKDLIEIDLEEAGIAVDDDVKYVYESYVNYFELLAVEHSQTFFEGLDIDELQKKIGYNECAVKNEKVTLMENLLKKFKTYQEDTL